MLFEKLPLILFLIHLIHLIILISIITIIIIVIPKKGIRIPAKGIPAKGAGTSWRTDFMKPLADFGVREEWDFPNRLLSFV